MLKEEDLPPIVTSLLREAASRNMMLQDMAEYDKKPSKRKTNLTPPKKKRKK